MKSKLLPIWKKWLYVSEIIGNVISRIILTILYFTIFAIPGIASRFFSDKLQTKSHRSTYWIETKDKIPKTIEESRNQG